MKAPKIPLKMSQITSEEFCKAMYEVKTEKEVRALIFAAAVSSKIDDDIFLGCISKVFNSCPDDKVDANIYPSCKFCDLVESCELYSQNRDKKYCARNFNLNSEICNKCEYYKTCKHDNYMEALKDMLKGDNDNV